VSFNRSRSIQFHLSVRTWSLGAVTKIIFFKKSHTNTKQMSSLVEKNSSALRVGLGKQTLDRSKCSSDKVGGNDDSEA
jgi:hypothetical protein